MQSVPDALVTARRLTEDDLPALYKLRLEVLRPGRPAEAAVFPGDELPTTVHLGAFLEDGRCVGIATLVQNQGVQLRGMAVDPSLQRRGIGAKLLALAYQIAEEQGQDSLWCNARTSAAAFYERDGWVREGYEFDIPDVGPHYRMRCLLNRR